MEANNEQQNLEAPVPETKPSTFETIKKWAGIIWHVPGVKNAALAFAAKVIVRAGLPVGVGALVIGIAEAIGSNL